jgi:hypothetical protein
MVVGILFFNHAAVAQEEEEEGSFIVIVTHKMTMPEDGSEAERDSLLKILYEVQKSNPKIVSRRQMQHAWGSNSQDWVVVTEYKTWADIEEAGKVNQELNRKKWPDAKERQAFFRQLGKYFDGHSDEIYQEMPQFRK